MVASQRPFVPVPSSVIDALPEAMSKVRHGNQRLRRGDIFVFLAVYRWIAELPARAIQVSKRGGFEYRAFDLSPGQWMLLAGYEKHESMGDAFYGSAWTSFGEAKSRLNAIDARVLIRPTRSAPLAEFDGSLICVHGDEVTVGPTNSLETYFVAVPQGFFNLRYSLVDQDLRLFLWLLRKSRGSYVGIGRERRFAHRWALSWSLDHLVAAGVVDKPKGRPSATRRRVKNSFEKLSSLGILEALDDERVELSPTFFRAQEPADAA